MDIKSIIKNRHLILEGVKNSIITREDVEVIAKERKAICDACPLKDVNRIGAEICSPHVADAHAITGVLTKGCGCSLHMKQRSLASSCPLEKWGAHTDDWEINDVLKNL